MARALGIGGVFFKSSDPEALAAWYVRWLGIELGEGFTGSVFQPGNTPPGGYTIWSPFSADTEYFAPSAAPFMINLMVDDLEGALAQVAEGGAQVMDAREHSEFGAFGWFLDPDGNKIELWQPPA